MSDEENLPGEAVSGLEHLQRAARELIAAARSVLDAAEELVDDPAAVRAVMDGVRSVVTVVAKAAGGGPSDEAGGDDDGPGSAIQRIDVS